MPQLSEQARARENLLSVMFGLYGALEAHAAEGGGVRANRFISEEAFTAMEKRVRGAAMRTGHIGESTAERQKPLPVARLASSPYNGYANKWELNYSQLLEMELRAGAIKSWKYAGITFTLAHRQYHRIDFIIGHNDRSIEIAQVKGYHPNMRAAIKGLKWAAQLYPMFTWTIKRWTGTGWDSNYVGI